MYRTPYSRGKVWVWTQVRPTRITSADGRTATSAVTRNAVRSNPQRGPQKLINPSTTWDQHRPAQADCHAGAARAAVFGGIRGREDVRAERQRSAEERRSACEGGGPRGAADRRALRARRRRDRADRRRAGRGGGAQSV